MYTLDEIRAHASKAANTFDFNWEKIDSDPMERQYLENTLGKSTTQSLIGELKTIHGKLTSGKSVVGEGTTALPYEDVEQYIMAVEEELFQGYILQELKTRYDLIRSVTKLVSE